VAKPAVKLHSEVDTCINKHNKLRTPYAAEQIAMVKPG
jgi:hypothetical protein